MSTDVTHIDDLPFGTLLSTLACLSEYTVTEKVDGSYLLFGVDEQGFYTARGTSADCRIYNINSYGMQYHETYMRAAHIALSATLPQLQQAGLTVGSQIEIEVLYGSTPNVVCYSPTINYIVLLRTVAGAANIADLVAAVNNRTENVSITAPYTPNGRYIFAKAENTCWSFATVKPRVVDYTLLMQDLKPYIDEVQTYLACASGIYDVENSVIENTPLNKCPAWCDKSNWSYVRPIAAESKARIRNILAKVFIPNIKSVLLAHLVHPYKSQFGPELSDGGWIEGVVLHNPVTGHTVKVVDKDVFLTVKNFLWSVRDQIAAPSCALSVQHSLLSKLKIDMATALGHPTLGTSQATRYIKQQYKNIGSQLTVLATPIDLQSVQQCWYNLLKQAELELTEHLNNYLATKDTLNIRVHNREFVYTGSVDKRTKETFSQTFYRIAEYIDRTNRATTIDDLIHVITGNKLANINSSTI